MRQVFMQRNAAAAAVREAVVVKKVGAHHDVTCLPCRKFARPVSQNGTHRIQGQWMAGF
jgi:hypothetical protein